jgi:hypothetical protein
MKDEAEDSRVIERIPFERGEPSAELWGRIEAAARANRRSSPRRLWLARSAALAAGALGWIALDAVLRPGRGAEVPVPRSSHSAWLSDGASGLPPEALLATLLVSRGAER